MKTWVVVCGENGDAHGWEGNVTAKCRVESFAHH